MIVDENNVTECFKFYEEYKENERKHNKYCKDASYDDFVDWCYEELYKCPNCGEIMFKDSQEHLDNLNGVCDQCIINGYYE